MLSDRERETLCEIERNLSDDDPKLAKTLEWPSERAHHRHVHAALIVLAVVLGVVALVLGHTTGALGCALVAGWTWGALQRRNRPEVRRSQVTD
ncbi:DUF3040 domain-containing protein [Lentzea sp. NEAU-D13]|uniref:DUF3040 domain-containing protein n=1 Tax=Lentzea alba TaxID=2714351 RepID=A0A7C9RW22_9PSEU|nr:DUF3040 domain-containing protein [Lentzea alba]NGY64264.1 DUF3040 domain-containing protein [Lentzea alba]